MNIYLVFHITENTFIYYLVYIRVIVFFTIFNQIIIKLNFNLNMEQEFN